MPSARSLIGAHVSVSRGLARGALTHAEDVRAEVVQVFVANPRGWAEPNFDTEADEAFRELCADRGVPVFVHAPYLLNFGSPSPETLRRSASALAFSLRRGAAIGARGVVVHAGSAVLGNRWDDAMAQVRSHLLPLLDAHEAGPRVLIEPTAGGGGALASTVESIGAYLDYLDDERVGVCLDTCHLHAAGHDMSTARGMSRTIAAVVRTIGARRIGLVHVNDSRDQCGSLRDRHAAIGAGTLGLLAFAGLFRAPGLRGLPFVVETADTDHAADIAVLKKLRDG